MCVALVEVNINRQARAWLEYFKSKRLNSVTDSKPVRCNPLVLCSPLQASPGQRHQAAYSTVLAATADGAFSWAADFLRDGLLWEKLKLVINGFSFIFCLLFTFSIGHKNDPLLIRRGGIGFINAH